jgi:hypothetical protein
MLYPLSYEGSAAILPAQLMFARSAVVVRCAAVASLTLSACSLNCWTRAGRALAIHFFRAARANAAKHLIRRFSGHAAAGNYSFFVNTASGGELLTGCGCGRSFNRTTTGCKQ